MMEDSKTSDPAYLERDSRTTRDPMVQPFMGQPIHSGDNEYLIETDKIRSPKDDLIREIAERLIESVRETTDLEKLKKVFDEIGQEYKVSAKSEADKYQCDCSLRIDSGIGYAGFLCEFYFVNGKRVDHGVWE